MSDDTKELQDKIDRATSSGGGLVELEAGRTYKVSTLYIRAGGPLLIMGNKESSISQ